MTFEFRVSSLSTTLRFALAGVAAAVSSLHAQQPTPHSPPPTPKLVVFITVDQLRPDYFERWGAQLTGGLARLYRQGAVFTSAYQDHAVTETAPGHASVMSGRFPRSTGIVQNIAGVQDPQAPLIDRVEASNTFPFLYRNAPGQGASPFRFRGTVLIDWMRIKDARSRALSVSRKDRGAILPLGRAKQDVYWYSENGIFTTSTYYRDTLPDWVEAFNAREMPRALAERRWDLLLPAAEYPEPDSVPEEHQGKDIVFPHLLSTDVKQATRELPGMPWMDQLILDMGLEGMERMGLGRNAHPDLVALSLSTTDAVGHTYGPDSREVHDQFLHLDRYLGAFLDSLYKLRDSSSVIVALTADHGVASYPRLRAARTHEKALYVDVERQVVVRMADSLARRGLAKDALRFDSGILFVDRDAFRAARMDPEPVLREMARRIRGMEGVVRVDRVRDLARGDTTRDYITRRWFHMLPSDQPAELVVTLQPGAYWGGVNYATHGTPHDEDAHVPVIFYGPWFRPGKYAAFTRVVDMAPTLARVLGVTPAERLDGRVLVQAIK